MQVDVEENYYYEEEWEVEELQMKDYYRM